MLGDRRKAVIGGYKNVRVLTQVYRLQIFQNLAEIVISIPHRVARRRTIDSRLEADTDVAPVGFGSVRIARTEHNNEGLLSLNGSRQNGVSEAIVEILVTCEIWW